MIKLLIADDEKIERDALRYIVQKGCASIDEIEEAVNGREAFEKSLRFHPDIIFLDIKMPGLNGIESARQIRKSIPHAKARCVINANALPGGNSTVRTMEPRRNTNRPVSTINRIMKVAI